MAWLRKILARIGEQLRQLSLSQRLVIVLSGVLVAGSLLWLVQWAAAPEMTPLLSQPLAAEELARIRSGLDAMSQSYEVRDSRIFVPVSANQSALIAHLQQNNQLPDSTMTSFETLIREANPWLPQGENDRRWTVALANKLEEVLRRFNGVRDAEVFLDLNNRSQRVLGDNMASSASVTLFMKNGETVSRTLALAAARLVSGAVRGVKLRAVSVVDGVNNKNALDWDDESEGGVAATLHKQKREQERVLAEKIRGQLGDPKVRVSVQVELDMTAKTKQRQEPIGADVIVHEETDNSERTRGLTAGQPGVQPNVGLAAGIGGGASSETRNTSTFQYEVGHELESTQTPSGAVKEVFAAINISHSYLESVFRRQAGGNAKATPDDITRTFDAEKARIVSQVSKLVKPPAPEQVAVDWYYDTVAADLAPDAGVEAGPAPGSTMDLVQRYGPQSALGLLALVSFALMLNMARKVDASDAIGMELGLPKEAIEAARQAARDAHEAVVARAAQPTLDEAAPLNVRAADGLLVGRELDEASVQTQNMIEQVASMVEKDPDAIAGLLEQWVRSTG